MAFPRSSTKQLPWQFQRGLESHTIQHVLIRKCCGGVEWLYRPDLAHSPLPTMAYSFWQVSSPAEGFILLWYLSTPASKGPTFSFMCPNTLLPSLSILPCPWVGSYFFGPATYLGFFLLRSFEGIAKMQTLFYNLQLRWAVIHKRMHLTKN